MTGFCLPRASPSSFHIAVPHLGPFGQRLMERERELDLLISQSCMARWPLHSLQNPDMLACDSLSFTSSLSFKSSQRAVKKAGRPVWPSTLWTRVVLSSQDREKSSGKNWSEPRCHIRNPWLVISHGDAMPVFSLLFPASNQVSDQGNQGTAGR